MEFGSLVADLAQKRANLVVVVIGSYIYIYIYIYYNQKDQGFTTQALWSKALGLRTRESRAQASCLGRSLPAVTHANLFLGRKSGGGGIWPVCVQGWGYRI